MTCCKRYFFAKHASMIPCQPPFSNHFCWDFCTGWGRISCLIIAKSKPSVFVLKSNIMRRHLCQVDHGLVPLEYLLQIHVNRSSFSGRWLSNATISEKHWLSFLILKIEKTEWRTEEQQKYLTDRFDERLLLWRRPLLQNQFLISAVQV